MATLMTGPNRQWTGPKRMMFQRAAGSETASDGGEFARQRRGGEERRGVAVGIAKDGLEKKKL